MSVVLVVLAIKVLIAPRGLSRHLIRPLKVWLVLDFLQHLMYWFSEHNIDSLCIGCSRLPYEISPQAVAVISGRGALLFVTKREPKAWVSCLYKSMEFLFKPLNHLIATSPKLDGKTLHISTSFLEWTAILWLNWLICSTGSVLPVIKSEVWLLESSRECSPFNVACER